MFLSLFLVLCFVPEESSLPDVDMLALDDEIIGFLEMHVGQIHDPVKRLDHLVHVIFDPQFLNLTYDNSRTKTAIETFNSRNGNCLSFTNMFVAMARHLGISANFQEVINLPTWDRQGSVVVLNRHMNALVRIHNKNYVLDFNPYEERVEHQTRVVSDKRARAQYYNNIGAEFFQKGDNETARQFFKKALEVDDQLSFAWSNLGVVYVKEGQLELAEKTYMIALECDSREFTAMGNLSKLYTKMGRHEEAQDYFDRVHKFIKRNPYYHYDLGEDAYVEGNYREALKHYKDALRRKSTDHEFYFALARTYMNLGEKDKVEALLIKARSLAPDVFDQNRYSQKLQALTANY